MVQTIQQPPSKAKAERPQFEQPTLEVRCGGDAREHGLAIGSCLQPKILRAQQSIPQLESFTLRRPWWMPLSLFQSIAQRRARWTLEPSFSRSYPRLVERIEGIAEGAKTSVDFLYLFHAMESAPADVTQPAMAGCTAMAARGRRTIDGRPIIAHNFDLVALAEPLLTLREISTKGGLRYLGFSIAPMAGVIDGVNEAGLAISYDFAPTTDIALNGPPISFAIDEALSTCKTVRQAARRLSRLPRGGGALLMLADAEGDIGALELSANHSKLRRPRSADVLAHSNAYQTKRMRRHEWPRTAVYSDQAPASLRRKPVYQSAERRDARIEKMLQSESVLSPDSISSLMSDHGPSECGSADTICMHGDYWSTLASLQLMPAERRIRVSFGRACQSRLVDFEL